VSYYHGTSWHSPLVGVRLGEWRWDGSMRRTVLIVCLLVTKWPIAVERLLLMLMQVWCNCDAGRSISRRRWVMYSAGQLPVSRWSLSENDAWSIWPHSTALLSNLQWSTYRGERVPMDVVPSQMRRICIADNFTEAISCVAADWLYGKVTAGRPVRATAHSECPASYPTNRYRLLSTHLCMPNADCFFGQDIRPSD